MPGQQQDWAAWIGCGVTDRAGCPLGELDDVYVDDESGEPEWLVVSTAGLAQSRVFVPWWGATVQEDRLIVGWDRRTVEAAPPIGAGDELDLDDEDELDRYYRRMTVPAETGEQAPAAFPEAVMIRSEERAHFATRRVESGRVRLRRYVVARRVTRAVPVSHEEIRVQREPITDAELDRGAVLSEGDYEVTLFEERPVVAKEVVAVERVRLSTQTVSGREAVSTEVRNEQIVDETLIDEQWRR